MKTIIYTTILLFLFSCSAKVVNFDQLQDRNGLYFLVNEEKPFSGEVVSYINGKLEFEGEVKNGLREGVWSYYYPTGQKRMAGVFTDGLKEGTWTYWKENGSQDLIEIYKMGQRLGNDTIPTSGQSVKDTMAAKQETKADDLKPANTVTKTATQNQVTKKSEPKKPQPVVWERLRGASVKFLDGIPYTGPVVKYFREGGKELDGEFVNGHRDGKWVYYDRYGNIKDVRYY